MIAIVTDFGADNHYVGQMKGRILGIRPEATIVDITHSIAPQNVLEGAFVLRDSVEAFPAHSIFVVVVDPGVGTHRRILVVESREQFFVLPDNGLISLIHYEFGIDRAISVDVARFDATSTFHGRDIMAPVAADLDLVQLPNHSDSPLIPKP